MDQLRRYLEENGRRERLEKLERFKQLNRYAKKGQIVFAGSSLAEQFPIHELLSSDHNTAIIYNRGIGGDIITNLSETLDTCIFELEPKKLFINIGTNDIGMPSYSETLLMQRYSALIDTIRQRLPMTSIYMLSYYPVNPSIDSHIPKEFREQMFMTRTNAAITSANQILKNIAAQKGCTYIDVSSVLTDDRGQLDSDLTLEGIHLWPIAYARVYEILKPFLTSEETL